MTKLIILVLVVVAGFLYWRGVHEIVKEKKLDCNWQTIIAVCTKTEKQTYTAPTIQEVFKAGIKF